MNENPKKYKPQVIVTNSELYNSLINAVDVSKSVATKGGIFGGDMWEVYTSVLIHFKDGRNVNFAGVFYGNQFMDDYGFEIVGAE
jgi:hypothetical protein